MKTKKVTIRVNRRNLTGIIRKTSFKCSGGMFIPYQFIAIDFDTEKNNTASFYESVQVNRNSWTNYPGVKVWENGCQDWSKAEVLEQIEENLERYLDEYAFQNENVEFELINF